MPITGEHAFKFILKKISFLVPSWKVIYSLCDQLYNLIYINTTKKKKEERKKEKKKRKKQLQKKQGTKNILFLLMISSGYCPILKGSKAYSTNRNIMMKWMLNSN